jgi:glycosyltransferase involved in cell wall biosynthesis
MGRESMKIALVAPVDEPVPPPRYGGVELVVHYLARQLVHYGHDVILLAAGGSRSAGRLVPTAESPLRKRHFAKYSSTSGYRKPAVARTIVSVIKREKPQLIHNHFRHLVGMEWALPSPTLTTIHYPLGRTGAGGVFHRHPSSRYVSISVNQRAPAPHLNFVANIHHGIPVEQFPFVANQGTYVAFVGRICPEKGVDLAIDAAHEAGVCLRIAAKLDYENIPYFRTTVQPRLQEGKVEFLGEVTQEDKRQLLGGARALLHPVRWREPFGLVLLEAMACGTPVIGFRRGAVPEIVLDGESGFLVGNRSEMATAIRDIGEISRSRCRAHVTQNFNVARMVRAYERLYRALISDSDVTAASSRVSGVARGSAQKQSISGQCAGE